MIFSYTVKHICFSALTEEFESTVIPTGHKIHAILDLSFEVLKYNFLLQKGSRGRG